MTENRKVNISSELKKLADKRRDNNQETACLFNVVIYLPDPKRYNYLREIYRVIAQRFPCRIFFVISDPALPKGTQDISVNQELTEKNQGYVGCDVIHIKISLDQLESVFFIVIPNLYPDVPIYLLWAQDPTTEKTLLPRLEPLAARLIFDSESTANLQHLAKRILNHYRHFPLDMIDLNWAMISRWRDVLYSVFDTQEKIDHLKHSKVIQIDYIYSPDTCFQHSNIPSIYFQGWIASCLNWKFISKEKDVLNYHTGTNRVSVMLHGVTVDETELVPGVILNVEITSEDNHSYHFRRFVKDEIVRIEASSEDRCELPTTLQMHTLKTGRTFLRDVFFHPIGEHYFNMLKVIENIEWHK